MALIWLGVLAFPLAATLNAHPPVVGLVSTLLAVALFVGLYVWLVLSGTRPFPDARGLASLAPLMTIAVVLTLGERTAWALLFIFTAAVAGAILREPLGVAGVTLCVLLAAVCAITAGADAGSVLVLAAGTAGIGLLILSIAGLRARNAELHSAREELARLAVADERLRFARDLHDLLGQSLSVIALKAELAGRLLDVAAGESAVYAPSVAGRGVAGGGGVGRGVAERGAAGRGVAGRGVADTDSESACAAARVHVGELEGVARRALSEVRETASGYRRPVLALELDGARMALEAAGIEARLDRAGAKLAPDVEALLAWTVREGTTNVIRHSGASRCRVVISTGAQAASVEVLDDGLGGALDHGAGLGLAGLRERAERLAGRLEAGAGPGGGFRLRVSVPSEQPGTAAA
jgi:two-component system, NarL family, sensor histidine kinase DesK